MKTYLCTLRRCFAGVVGIPSNAFIGTVRNAYVFERIEMFILLESIWPSNFRICLDSVVFISRSRAKLPNQTKLKLCKQHIQ